VARLAAGGTKITGVGIQDDILYGPRQVKALLKAARAGGVQTTYREIRSNKGHDAFLVEWDQLTTLLREALASGRPDAERQVFVSGSQGLET
jgi:homoserine O-acetyltransferase